MPSPSVTSKFISLSNEGPIVYTERVSLFHGEAPFCRTIILVHGLDGTVNTFHPIYAPLLTGLPSGSVLLAYDWSGSGLSPARKGSPPSIYDLVGDLETLIDSEVPTGFIDIIAHSAGTFLAVELLLSLSSVLSRVIHVALIAGPSAIPLSPQMVALQEQFASVVEKQGIPALVDGFCPMLLGETTLKENPLAVTVVRSVCMTQSSKRFSTAVRALSSYGAQRMPYVFENIPTDVKVLFIGGTEDKMVSLEVLDQISKRIKGSRVVSLQKVGHTPTVEDPIACASELVSFLKT